MTKQIYLIAEKDHYVSGQGGGSYEYSLGSSVWGEFNKVPKIFYKREDAESYISNRKTLSIV